MTSQKLVPLDQVAGLIRMIRGQKVIIDVDLAALYGVETKRLNEQVRRNMERFPSDFMFQLTSDEIDAMRSQFATSKNGKGGRTSLPYVFTEHGAIMAASVLNTPLAVEMSIFVVRAFVQMRSLIGSHKELAEKIADLESKVGTHDKNISDIIKVLKQLTSPPAEPTKRKIGF